MPEGIQAYLETIQGDPRPDLFVEDTKGELHFPCNGCIHAERLASICRECIHYALD